MPEDMAGVAGGRVEVELDDDEDVSDERDEDKDGARDGACTAGELFTSTGLSGAEVHCSNSTRS